jgi:hypothetical protein
MVVVAQVSSMNTSRSGLKAGGRARQARRAAATSGRSCSAACRVFFRVRPAAARNRLIAEGLTSIPAAASRVRSSALVRSGSAAKSACTRSACAASFARLPPPIRSGASVPRRRQRCISLITKLGLTSNLAAVARRDAPPSTVRTTRSRRSTEYGRAIHGWPPRPSRQLESQQPHVVNPKSIPSNRIML